MISLTAKLMNAEDFAPYGDLIDFERKPDFAINNGMCDRYHALATSIAEGTNANTIISLGRARPYTLPLALTMMERHPFGSQAFIPLGLDPFLVVVAGNNNGRPVSPVVFLTKPGQGVNYYRNTWHAVLTPLGRQADFLIVDREGEENNLEEFFFDVPFEITLSEETTLTA